MDLSEFDAEIATLESAMATNRTKMESLVDGMTAAVTNWVQAWVDPVADRFRKERAEQVTAAGSEKIAQVKRNLQAFKDAVPAQISATMEKFSWPHKQEVRWLARDADKVNELYTKRHSSVMGLPTILESDLMDVLGGVCQAFVSQGIGSNNIDGCAPFKFQSHTKKFRYNETVTWSRDVNDLLNAYRAQHKELAGRAAALAAVLKRKTDAEASDLWDKN